MKRSTSDRGKKIRPLSASFPLTYFTFSSWLFALFCQLSAAFHVPLSLPPRTQPSHGACLIPSADSSCFPPDDCMGQFDQDLHGKFRTLHRPLSLRDESQPARGLWLFEQPFQTIPTVHNYARMAVYALADGSVLAYNPIAPTEETLREIEDAFGDPDHIIVPTTAHNNKALVKGWAKRFPRATFWGLEGVKLPGAKFTRDLTTDSFPEEWKAELDISILEGNRMFRECFMLHRSTKTVFAMDSLVEMGEANIPHPVLRAGSIMAGKFGRPVCPTKALMWNREQCQAAITKVLGWDFDTVYATHGACPIKHAKDAIRDEFQFLWD